MDRKYWKKKLKELSPEEQKKAIEECQRQATLELWRFWGLSYWKKKKGGLD